MYNYALQIHEEPNGVWLSCPDLPEMHASGESVEEALSTAADALETTLSLYVDQHRAIPPAVFHDAKHHVLYLPALTVAKIVLWNAMCEEGVSRSELARRLGCPRQLANRLVDFLHASKIEQVERALRELGRRLNVTVQAA